MSEASGRMGARVKIVGGSKAYRKNDGAWINLSKGDQGYTPVKIHVLVQFGPNLVQTCLMQKSVVVCSSAPPASYVEAVLDQHPLINPMMDKLAMIFARCEIKEDNDVTAMFVIFQQKLDTALDKLAHDSEATYYKTTYDNKNNMEV